MTDVLIAGGGVAGSAAALLLGRAGLSVEVFEQHSFPREKACAEGIMPAGVGTLQRLGLAGSVGGARFVGIRYHGWGQSVATAFPSTEDVPPFGLGQRRLVLDATLFGAARFTRGVTAHENARVEGPVIEHGRVTGLVVDGEIRRGKLVVGADGPRSVLRRKLGLEGRPGRQARLGVRAHFRLARGQTPPDHVEIFVAEDHELYLTPLPDNEVSLAALTLRDALDENARTSFERWRRQHPSLAALLEGAEQTSDLAGRTPLQSRARAGACPGLVLVGDAAGFIDPVTGSGMAQALLSAELLVRLLGHALTPGAPFAPATETLLEFDRQRRQLVRGYAALTKFVLWLSLRPFFARRMLGILRASPALFRHLVGVAAGSRPLIPL